MVQISIRIDNKVKEDVEKVCDDIGISLSEAINIYLKKTAREKRIPFDLSTDFFYSESNIKHLENIINDIKEGKTEFTEHDLIED